MKNYKGRPHGGKNGLRGQVGDLSFGGSIFAPDKLSIPKFMLLTVCNGQYNCRWRNAE